MRPSPLIALFASVALHLALVGSGMLVSPQAGPQDPEQAPDLDLSEPGDDEGELPIEPLSDLPFQVSLYVEPAPVAVASAPAAPRAPAAAPAPVP
ncbi:MAG: hypothetical protein Q8P41_11980, partial [Pseudomonadota bacterium]|nr:hypothetical protein [Pseudomonadota bacterium]